MTHGAVGCWGATLAGALLVGDVGEGVGLSDGARPLLTHRGRPAAEASGLVGWRMVEQGLGPPAPFLVTFLFW